MEHTSVARADGAGRLIVLVVIFFLFPIFWIFLMSFQTNEEILRIPPSLFFTPTLTQLLGSDHGQAGYGVRHARHRIHEKSLE